MQETTELIVHIFMRRCQGTVAINVASVHYGRPETVAGDGMLGIADSTELARLEVQAAHSDLVHWTSVVGDAFSLTGLVETGHRGTVGHLPPFK